MKNEYFIILTSAIVIYMIRNVVKSRMPVKESFFWMIGSLVALVLSIFPKSIDGIAKFVGVSYAPTLFLVIYVLFLTFMIFRNSKRIAEQQEKINELGQQVAYLKNEVKKHSK